MKACVDVHYRENQAFAALVLFDDWESEQSVATILADCPAAEDYAPGEFYKRELKPILHVLDQTTEKIDTLVVDGYCELSPDGEKGLGARVADALEGELTVVGVAKSRFRRATHAVEVLRGTSDRPLYVTTLGCDAAMAAQKIENMHGEHRIPTLLKLADTAAREGVILP